MSPNRLYHNPRCSKSRATLALLAEKGIEIAVVEYLQNPPSAEELESICDLLGVEPLAITRTNETLFSDLGLSKSDGRSRTEWIGILARNPRLLQRPILIYNGKAAVGRPPEKILDILS